MMGRKKALKSTDPWQGVDSLATEEGDATEIKKQTLFGIFDTILYSCIDFC